MSRTVVVLGAGAGGLAAAERLRGNLPAADRIELIDRSFTPSLGLSALRVLRGWRAPRDVVSAVGPAALPGVSMTVAEVTTVDPDARTVRYRRNGTGGTLDYDALLVALGTDLDTAAVPGLDAALAGGAAGQFYTVDGAAELARRVDALESGRLVVLVPALPFRCPPAPYEAAFLIAERLGEKFTGGRVRVDIVTCEPRPIPVVGPDVGDAVVGMLDARGIGFQPGRPTAAIDADGRTVTFTDGTEEPFDLLAVVPPHRSAAASVLPDGTGPGGWIPVDPQTLATKLPGVWAVGDNTTLVLAHDKPLPKAAIFAEGEARTAADQITRYLGYDAPESRFSGVGGCVMEVGDGLAAKVEGDFLAAPEPRVTFYPPNADLHAAKADQERDWLARWAR